MMSELPDVFALPRGSDTPTLSTSSDYDSANNTTPPPPQPLPRSEKCKTKNKEKDEISQVVVTNDDNITSIAPNSHNNCQDGQSSTLSEDSPEDDFDLEEDNKSLSNISSHSSRDSGCGKTSRRSTLGDKDKNRKQASDSQQDLDISSTLLWSASLLYYTGLPSPKVKEHHITSPPPPRSSSSFYLAHKLRSALSMSDMDRPRSPLKKFSTLPKSLSKDSGTGSSVVDDSIAAGGNNESGTDSSNMSPLRKRHASCSSSSSIGSSGMMGTLKGRIKNTNSLRLLKISRPSLSSFLEKTQSLPRSRKSKNGEDSPSTTATAIPEGSSVPVSQHDSGISDGSKGEGSTTASSSSSLKSAKKALRDSFKAARNLLPIPSSSSFQFSSSKVSPSGKPRKGKRVGNDDEKLDEDGSNSMSCDEQDKKNRSGDGERKDAYNMINSNDGCQQSGSSSTTVNCSAPNTPMAIKKSRLGRARKRFASTLSLHSSNDGKSNNGGSSGGPSSLKSKSTSTLVISDSEVNTAPCGVVHNLDCPTYTPNTEDTETVLSIVEDNSSYSKNNKSPGLIKKGDQNPSTKSPFRFMSRSKNKKKDKEQSDTLGVEKTSDSKGLEISDKIDGEKEAIKQVELKGKLTTGHKDISPEGKEKPSKKRNSIVKSIGKVIWSGKNSMSNQQPTMDSVIVNKTSTFTMESEAKDKSQEIVKFDNEPRVRTPKAPRRHRLNSGSGSSGSCTGYNTSTQSTSASTPEQDKDREFPEIEVSETSIDISPQKLACLVKDNMAPVLTAPTNGTMNEQNGQKHDSNGTNNDDHNPSNSHLKPTSDEKKSESTVTKSRESEIELSAKEQDKSTKKSQGFIASLVSPEKKNDTTLAGDDKKKKKNSKKGKKKSIPSSELPSNSVAKPEHEISPPKQPVATVTNVNSESDNKVTILLTGKSSSTQNSIPAPELSLLSNRRKSSDDFKDLRKNASAHEAPVFVLPLDPGPKKKGSLESKGGEDSVATNVNGVINRSENGIGKARRERKDTENSEVETDDPDTACTASFRQLKPFNYDLEPVEEGKKERLYKVLVVGELGAGKTSIIKRYVHQFFSQHYRATIGVDFALKVLRWDPDTVVRLQLWDIAGQERFGSMTRVYYKEAVGAFVVFDVTRSATLEAVPKWKADLDAKVALPDGRPIPTVLLANKSDQPKEGIAANREKMNEFCQQQGFSAWFETSAKDNINIDESANFLVSKILEMDKWSQEPLVPDPDKLDLTANGKLNKPSSSNCAC